MKNRIYAAIAAVLVIWLSWLFRYAPSSDGGVFLDRWTGDAVRPFAHDRRSLGDIPADK